MSPILRISYQTHGVLFCPVDVNRVPDLKYLSSKIDICQGQGHVTPMTWMCSNLAMRNLENLLPHILIVTRLIYNSSESLGKDNPMNVVKVNFK